MAINRAFREPGHLYTYDAVTLGQALETGRLQERQEGKLYAR